MGIRPGDRAAEKISHGRGAGLLNEEHVYEKERRLIEEIRAELNRGRRCQIYAVYTQKRDVSIVLTIFLLTDASSVNVPSYTSSAPLVRASFRTKKVNSKRRAESFSCRLF
jgi:hypothetical protein